jgi:pimeloyl-ACP methyl ester carboxylesterase
MSPGTSVGRIAALAGAAMGVVAAGVTTRAVVKRSGLDAHELTALGALGSLHGEPMTVRTADGLKLHVEVDDVDPADGADGAEGPDGAEGTANPPHRPTVVFVHGYALNLRSWHFQRRDLRGDYRQVFYDQRSHGRSERSDRHHANIDQLGRDLLAVLDATAPTGPVVLVGHSMGGMTIMALADQHPEMFGSRVTGVALIATSVGGLGALTLGLPGLPGRFIDVLAPATVALLARAPAVVDSGRRVGGALGFAVTRRTAFGTRAPAAYVEFTDQMLQSTPIDVVADFLPGFDSYDKVAALVSLSHVQTLILCGSQDKMTPVRHSRETAERLPTAEFCEIEGAGHMVILERHDEVNRSLRDLLARASGTSPR